MGYLVAALALGALCGAWALLQRWISRRAPDVRSIEGACHGCGGCGNDCASEPRQLPTATARERT